VLKRVQAAPYTGKLYSEDDPFDAEVKITLNDGRSFSAKVDRPLGRASDNAIAYADMKAKFENCAARILSAAAAARAGREIESFENVPSLRDFTKLLEPGHA
jgi:hypothetical protein